MRTRIASRIALGFIVPFVLLVLIVLTSIVQMNALTDRTALVASRVALDDASHDVLLQIVSEDASVRAYVDTGDTAMVDAYERASTQIEGDIDTLRAASAIDPKLIAIFARELVGGTA